MYLVSSPKILCLTLCKSMDCGLPGSSDNEIFQARILEMVAISFSRGSSASQGLNPGLLHCRPSIYCLSHQESKKKKKNCTLKSNISTI